MRDIVVFGEDWGRHPSSTQHLIKQFLPNRRVIWVDSLGLRMPKLNFADAQRVCQKARSILKRCFAPAPPETQDQGGPHSLIAPIAIPIPDNRFAAAANRSLVSAQIKRAMRNLDIQKPIFWTSLPTAEPLIGSFDHGPVVYYAGDDFGALAGVDHKQVVNAERRLVKKTDFVFAASDVIADRFPSSKTAIIRHGVDTDLFSAPTTRPDDLPLLRPIIGFYGSISGWIDLDLLHRLAKSRSDCDIVLIGSITVDVSSLHRLPNVYFLGSRPHAQLPSYAQHFDVAILPFIGNDQIKACDPLKLREYLASGAPVASTDFPALDPYRALIHVGQTPESFLEAVDAAMTDKARATLRRKAVAGDTWRQRADDVATILDLIG